MKRKRLNHCVDTLCDMFCGWQVFFDYNQLLELGNGKLRIDILKKECFFNDEKIGTLSIAKAVSSWFFDDCKNNNIELNNIHEVSLIVGLDFSIIDANERTDSVGEQFFDAGKEIKVMKMNRCRFKCEGIVKTDEKEYKKEHERVREWPIGWPKNG